MFTSHAGWFREHCLRVLIGIVVSHHALCLAQPPANPTANQAEQVIKPIAPLTPTQTEWKAKRIKQWEAVDKLLPTNLAGAIENMVQVLKRDEREFGPEHPETAQTILKLADIFWNNGKPDLSKTLRDKEVQIYFKAYGKDDWRFRSAFCRHKSFTILFNATQAAIDRDIESVTLEKQANLLLKEQKFDKALAAIKKAIEIEIAIFSEDSTTVANDLLILANIHKANYQYEEAEKAAEKAATIFRDWLGTKSPDYSDALVVQAYIAEQQGRKALFEKLALQALAAAEGAAECPLNYLATADFCLARSFLVNGATVRAEQHFQKALVLYTNDGDASSFNAIRTQAWLGDCAIRLDRIEEANGILDKVETILRQKYPKEISELLNIYESRAGAFSSMGKHQQAIDAYERVLIELRKLKLERSPRAADILEIQARLEYRLLHLEKAEDLFNQALEIKQASPGTPQTSLRVSMVYAKDVFEAAMSDRMLKDDLPGARKTLERWLQWSRSIMGPKDDQTITVQFYLEHLDRIDKLNEADRRIFRKLIVQAAEGVKLLYETKPVDPAKTVELLENTLSGYIKLWGQDLLCIAESRMYLAEAYIKSNQPDRAEEEYRRAEPVFIKLYGESNAPPSVATLYMALSKLCNKRQNYTEALSRARQAQVIFRRFGGDRSEYHYQATEQIGSILVAMREYEQAQSLYREAIELVVRARGKQSERYAELTNKLGVVQYRSARFAEAEKSYLDSLASYESLQLGTTPAVAQVHQNLGLVYQQLRQFEPAVKHLQQSIEIATKTKEAEVIAQSQAILGVIYGVQEKYVEAQVALESAIDALESLGISQATEVEKRQNELETIWITQALAFESKYEFDKAIPFRKKLLEQRKRRFPFDVYTVRDPALFLALDEQLMKFDPAQIDQYRAANKLLEKANGNRNFPQAVQELTDAAEKFQALLGQKNLRYVNCLEKLSSAQVLAGNLPAAVATLEKARPLLVEMLGDSPYVATNLRTTSQILQGQGKSIDAIQAQREIVVIYERLLSKVSTKYDLALARSQLGESLLYAGDLAAGSELILQARGILLPARTSFPGFYRENLAHLILLNTQTGNYQQALPGAQELVEVARQYPGDKSMEYSVAADRLSQVLLMLGNLDEAEKLAREVLANFNKILTPSHMRSALAAVNLANILRAKGDFTVSESLYSNAIVMLENSGNTAATRNVRFALVSLYLESGDLNRAKEQLKHLDGQNKDAGFISYATFVYLHEGKMPEAAALAIQHVQLAEKLLLSSSNYLNEQQQIKTMQFYRQSLDRLLSADPSGRPASESYAQLLRWKGAIFSRQQRLRKASSTPEGTRLLEQWGAASGQLATLFLRPPYAHEASLWSDRVAQFTREKDRAELEIIKLLKNDTVIPVELEKVKASLPVNSALIDFLSYQQYIRGKDGKFQTVPCYVAFIVRPNREVFRVTIPNSVRIDQLIDQWREGLSWRSTAAAKEAIAKKDYDKVKELYVASVMSQEKLAADLKTLLWEPFAARLDGVDTVLISPDQSLAKFPFAALPGKAKNTFLIEDMAIAIVPVPQAIPDLVERRSKVNLDSNSMFLMGDIDYSLGFRGNSNFSISRDSLRARLPFNFTPLNGTGPEVREIQTRFTKQFPKGNSVLLEKAQATEQTFRRSAPQHRWIHLATHGFFAEKVVENAASVVPGNDSSNASLTSKHHPLLTAPEGLMSGLAFAGANDVNQSYEDDGILCAMEVAAFDLSNVELVVMSACETGLGKTLSGEGVLGLQRAFQVAGARSTISSLWPVDDQASRLIMNQFYKNLWDKKLTKLEALRDTQLWIINSARKQKRTPINGADATIDSTELPNDWRLPEYWAPFILCGEWN